MYSIRFHGRGGQGIKTASQVLGSALFRAGFEVQDAPRYGAERRGAPIFAYVRASRGRIHERGVITRPDLVLVAEESLVTVPAAGVLQGLAPHTVFVVVSAVAAGTWRERLGLTGPVLAIATEEEAGANGMACTGAAARLLGVVPREQLAEAIREETARLGTAAVHASLERGLAAFDAMAEHAGLVREGPQALARDYATPDWIEVPLDAARIAAPDIHGAATSEAQRTGVWRTMRPVIDLERCHRCSWVCSTLCPDGAIDVAADRTPSVDYEHCKGCMICVAVCPSHAIRAVAEREAV